MVAVEQWSSAMEDVEWECDEWAWLNGPFGEGKERLVL